MDWIRCVGCEKLQSDFMAQTFALIAQVQYVLLQVPCSYETIPNAPKYYEMDRNAPKYSETLVLGPMGQIGCVRCEKHLT